MKLRRRLFASLMPVIAVVACVPDPGTPTSTTTTTTLPSNAAVSIEAGEAHTCAALVDGTVRCWGDNHWGKLGNGTTTDSAGPVVASGATGATRVVAGGNVSCSWSPGVINGFCWGYNGHNQLLRSGGTYFAAPQTINLAAPQQLAIGHGHSCIRISDGRVSCWGDNTTGQLGGGSVGGSAYPSQWAAGITTATDVAAGGAHTCAVLADRTARCWGANNSGELGTGATTNNAGVGTPQLVTGSAAFVSIAAGGSTCATTTERTVLCWGPNQNGQLGNGSTVLSATPVPVAGLTDVAEVAVGAGHACALLGNGTVWCWGRGASGQLGNGSSTNSSTPVPVSGLTGATAVTAGDAHTCALIAGGTVRCWGSALQLGNGSTANSNVPVAVTAF